MKKVLGMFLAVCMLMSVICSFNITASATTEFEQPTISVSNGAKAINVKWSKIVGIESYKVYKKVAGAKKYCVVKTTNGNTSKFVDSKVAAGKTYYYKVSAVKNSKNVVTTATKSIVRLVAPKKVKVTNYVSNPDKMNTVDVKSVGSYNMGDTYQGVKIAWTKTNGANKYDIYRKVKKGKYTKIGTTKSLCYIDEDANNYSGKACYYKVVAKKNNSKSVASSVKKIIHVNTPIAIGNSTGKGIKLSWIGNAKGCDGYRVYTLNNEGVQSFSLVATLDKNKTTYLDKSVSVDGTKAYKIVAYKGKTTSEPFYIAVKYNP